MSGARWVVKDSGGAYIECIEPGSLEWSPRQRDAHQWCSPTAAKLAICALLKFSDVRVVRLVPKRKADPTRLSIGCALAAMSGDLELADICMRNEREGIARWLEDLANKAGRDACLYFGCLTDLATRIRAGEHRK